MSDARAVFGKHGLRWTRQRDRVYSALACAKAHPTAEELLDLVRADEPGLSLATVYNTLDMLCGAGLARRLHTDAADRYDAETGEHVHLQMPDGSILDVPEELSERLLERFPDDLVAELERRTGLRIGRVSLKLVVEPRE